MNFFKPIRQTYVDSTLYDKQRTTQNGIIEYLCESTRYAEKMVIFDQGSAVQNNDKSKTLAISSVDDALKNFYDIYAINSTTYPNSDDLEDAKRRVRVIVINRKSTYDKNGKYQAPGGSGTTVQGFRGRLITNIDDNSINSSKHYAIDDKFKDEDGQRTKAAEGISYMALGGAYYGDCDYDIYIDADKTFPSGSYAGGITFGVVSSMRNTGNVVQTGKISGGNKLEVGDDYVTLKTVQGNLTKNLDSFDYFYNKSSKPHGSITETGAITGGNQNTYIVFMVPDENDR